MKKGRIKYTLKNGDLLTEYEGNCLYHEEKNILIYKEQNDMEVMLELDRLILTRENKETFILLDFYGGESYVLVKDIDKKVPVTITVYKKELTENSLTINYTLSTDEMFFYNVEWVMDGDY